MAATLTSLACGPQGTNQGNTGQTLLLNATGGGLTGTTIRAKIGSRTVTATGVSDTQISCTVPGGCGVASVIAIIDGVASSSLPFYYIPGPTGAAISPAEGPAASPPQITISGDNLLTVNQATFGGVAGTGTAASGDNAAVSTPAAMTAVGASPWFQSVSVAVRTAGGSATLSDTFNAYDTPTVTTLTPNSGSGGTEVVVDGSAFVGDTLQITFGGVQAEFTAISDTQLLATAPTDGLTGAADVVVTTPGGSSTAVTFTYP